MLKVNHHLIYTIADQCSLASSGKREGENEDLSLSLKFDLFYFTENNQIFTGLGCS